MLHILNGDATKPTFENAGISGEVIIWREILMEGPVNQYEDLSQFWKDRSEYLHQTFGADVKAYLQTQKSIEEKFNDLSGQEEVVFWFDTDLFCQVNLMFLMYWFAKLDPNAISLSLVCPHPLNHESQFHGLSTLKPEQINSLFKKRLEIKPKNLDLYAKAWKSYAATEPNQLLKFYKSEAMESSLLYNSLHLHFQRYPTPKTGLNIIQKEILNSVLLGNTFFSKLFKDVTSHKKIQSFGTGDWQFLKYLQELSGGKHPLLQLNDLDKIKLHPKIDSRNWDKYYIELTDSGRNVLLEKEDRVHTNGIHQWLGGVLLSGNECWRWDSTTNSFEFS